jgi:GH24 family phage-related lysozyme (muramidase)
MEAANLNDLKKRVKLHEGFSAKPYRDTLNKMTVGYGHLCVEDFWDENTEYTEAQLDRIFDTDFDKAIEGAARVCEGMDLPDKKFGVFIEMTFQLGATGLSKFKKALAAAREHQWQECHDQLLDSRWYKQTPNRAKQLAEIMLED